MWQLASEPELPGAETSQRAQSFWKPRCALAAMNADIGFSLWGQCRLKLDEPTAVALPGNRQPPLGKQLPQFSLGQITIFAVIAVCPGI
jgi:hypothetical protein